jgi:predicted ATP-binding protein involved in virulence
MKVKNLKLLNFRGIKELSVDFTRHTTAFVGVNGVGKTTTLDALAIGLSQLTWRINGNPQKARPISPDDIAQGADFARIEITVELRGMTISWSIVQNRKQGKYSDALRSSNFEALNAAVRRLDAEWEHVESERQENYRLPLSVFYDVRRAVTEVPLRVREKLLHNPYEAYQDALDRGGADFKRFFIWYRNFEDVENEGRVENPSFRYPGLNAARNAIMTFTGFSDVRVRRTPSMRMVVMKGGKEFNVLQLSDGERVMLALLGDLSRRLSVLNPGLANPNEGDGVVLIDEIDLHLHPGWQRDVVNNLEGTFPNCQFIVSTHSPQVVGELLPGSVKRLRDGRLLEPVIRSIGLSSDEVLEELMNGRARNAGFQDTARNIERAIEEERYSDAREMLTALPSEFQGLPEILRLEESLEWFDPTEKVDSPLDGPRGIA